MMYGMTWLWSGDSDLLTAAVNGFKIPSQPCLTSIRISEATKKVLDQIIGRTLAISTLLAFIVAGFDVLSRKVTPVLNAEAVEK